MPLFLKVGSLIASLSAKLFPKEQIPTRVPEGLELLEEDLAREVLSEIAEERVAGTPALAEDEERERAIFEEFGLGSKLPDQTGIEDLIAKEFETEEERVGGPASAQEAPQDPASIVDQNTRSLEDILEIGLEIARIGVPVKDEIKTIAAGSIL